MLQTCGSFQSVPRPQIMQQSLCDYYVDSTGCTSGCFRRGTTNTSSGRPSTRNRNRRAPTYTLCVPGLSCRSRTKCNKKSSTCWRPSLEAGLPQCCSNFSMQRTYVTLVLVGILRRSNARLSRSWIFFVTSNSGSAASANRTRRTASLALH